MLLLLALSEFTIHSTPRSVGWGGGVVDVIGRHMRTGDLWGLGVGVDTVVLCGVLRGPGHGCVGSHCCACGQ